MGKYNTFTITEMMKKIRNNEVYLPALQRHFVWKYTKIEKLFDSIMKGYPIGTFLFWKVDKGLADTYTFYEFISNYHQKDKYLNDKAKKPELKDEIIGVLDGQQRLSSMYIALQGTYAYKIPYKWENNKDAYPSRELYLNLLHAVNESNSEEQYEFSFLTVEEAKVIDDKHFWYKVKDILKWNDQNYDSMADDFVDDKLDFVKKEQKKNARTMLKRLCRNILIEDIINYYELTNPNLDNILDIFVRVNSAGQQLSKSDLLFSTIVANWDNARDEIEKLIDQMNGKGDGFRFNTDFVMRSCLVLTNCQVLFKIENFKKENIGKIKEAWSKIENTLLKTIDLLVELGFSGENLVSYNAVIPIAYYLYKGGKLADLDKLNIKKYLIVSTLNGVFGTHGDHVLGSLRNEFDKKNDYAKFDFDWLKTIRIDNVNPYVLTADQINGIFEDNQKNAYTYMILMLLYPSLKLNQVRFDQDHIHPYVGFSKSELKKIGLSDEKIAKWQIDRNKLPNLELLESGENRSKQDTPFANWLASVAKDSASETAYKKLHYIPLVSYELKDFQLFYSERKKLMVDKILTLI